MFTLQQLMIVALILKLAVCGQQQILLNKSSENCLQATLLFHKSTVNAAVNLLELLWPTFFL